MISYVSVDAARLIMIYSAWRHAMFVEETLRTRGIVSDAGGRFYLVLSRSLDPITLKTFGVVVEPISGGERTALLLGAVRIPGGGPLFLPEGWTTLGRFLTISVLKKNWRAFATTVEKSLTIESRATAYGLIYPFDELYGALSRFNDARRTNGSAYRRSETLRSDPHYPGKPRLWCVVCGTRVRMMQGDKFPVHNECRSKNRNSLSVRYCSYCGEDYTVAELHSRFPAISSLNRQLSCPDGEEFRSTAREIR